MDLKPYTLSIYIEVYFWMYVNMLGRAVGSINLHQTLCIGRHLSHASSFFPSKQVQTYKHLLWIERCRSKTSLLTPPDGTLGLHLANLSCCGSTGGTAADSSHRTTDGGTNNDAGGTGNGRATLSLLLHPLVGRVGLGHGLLLLLHVCIVHDEGILGGGGRRGRNERGGGVHLILETTIPLAAGSKQNDARVDNGITRAVDSGRGRHDEWIDWEVARLLLRLLCRLRN